MISGFHETHEARKEISVWNSEFWFPTVKSRLLRKGVHPLIAFMGENPSKINTDAPIE